MGEDNKILDNELEKIQKERDEYLEGWKRAKADLINYKKEEVGRLEEIAKYGNEDLIIGLVGVLDNFDLALSYAVERNSDPASESKTNSSGIEKGIYMIRTQIEDILRQKGLKKMNTSPGDKFDPSQAEAIVEVESEKPPGTVVEIIESGYYLHDKLLRPARVKVSKNKSTEVEN